MDTSQYYVTSTYTGPDPRLAGTRILMSDLVTWDDECDQSARFDRSTAESHVTRLQTRCSGSFPYTKYSIQKVHTGGRAIRVTIRKQLGLDVAFPVNEAARILAKIAGTRALELETLAFASELGHTIELTPDAELGRLHDAIALLTLS